MVFTNPWRGDRHRSGAGQDAPLKLVPEIGARRAAGIVLLFGIGAMAGAVAYQRLQDAKADVAQLDLLSGSLAVLLMAFAVFGVGLTWIAITRWLDSSRPPPVPLLRFFLLTWPARYIPGTLPYHASRILMAERFGVRRTAVAGSIGYEAVLQLGAAGLLGVIGILLSAAGSSRGLYFAALPPLLLLPVALHPAVLVPALNRALSVVRRPALPRDAVLTMGQTLAAFACYLVAYVLNGAAFFFILKGISANEIDLFLAIGAFNLAGAAGIAVVFVPSGIGVREGVIVALMSTAVRPEEALLAAGAARAASLVADVLPVVLLGLADGTAKLGRQLRLASQRSTSNTQPRQPIRNRVSD